MYQKCVCFIFLVILAVLSCTGFRIDNLAMTDFNKKNLLTSLHSNTVKYIRTDTFYRPHKIRHHRLWRTHNHMRYPTNSQTQTSSKSMTLQQSTSNNNNNKLLLPYKSLNEETIISNTSYTNSPNENLAQIPPTDFSPISRPQRSPHQQHQRHSPSRNRTKWSRHQNEDIFSKAFKATYVILAEIESKNIDESTSNGSCEYYVKVIKDFKGNVGMGNAFWFVKNFYKQMLTAKCVLVKKMNNSKKYLLLLNKELRLLDAPKPKERVKNLIKRLKRVCKPGFVPTKPRIIELKEVRPKKRKKPEKHDQRKRIIVCKVNGFPPPKIVWKIRNQELHHNRLYAVRYRSDEDWKQSKLIIKNDETEPMGPYECVAKNLIGNTTSKMMAPPLEARECAAEYKEGFCQNGGTCFYEDLLKTYGCYCPENYTGVHCEIKTSNTSMYSQPDLYTCKLGLSTKYNC